MLGYRRLCIRPYVRTHAPNFHRKQTAGPESAKCGSDVLVDKISSRKSSTFSTFVLKVKDSKSRISRSSNAIISQTMTDRDKHYYCHQI